MTTTAVGFCAFPPARARAKVEIVHWDGRLDNRRDLESILRRPSGAPASDDGLALATYERWGIEGLGRVSGDWSLILRDARRQAIVLASDYAGVRPLFYVRGHDGITWSSRLEELVEATGRTAIDEAYVAAFLTVGGHPTRTRMPASPACPRVVPSRSRQQARRPARSGACRWRRSSDTRTSVDTRNRCGALS